MKGKIAKRLLSVLLTMCMVFMMTPFAVSAETEDAAMDFTKYVKNADLSVSAGSEPTAEAGWDTTETKGIADGMCKVSSGKSIDFSQVITLPPGQYKMTAYAVYRYGADEQTEYDAIQAGTDTHFAKLYAETKTCRYETDVMNRYEGASGTDYASGSGSVTVNELFVPNSSSAVAAWFTAGKYCNEIVFNVQKGGEVKIGIAKTTSPDAGDYMNIGAWTLTRISETPQLDPNDCTAAIRNAELTTTEGWDTRETKGIENGMCKVSSGKIIDFCQNIHLSAGKYKMTVNAVYRYGGDEQTEYDAIQAGTNTHFAKLYAETETYRYEDDVMNRYAGASETNYYTGDDAETAVSKVNNLYVPNSSNAVKAWFEEDAYVNELVFNVQQESDVKIGIAKTAAPDAGDYTNIGSWHLVRLGDAEEDPHVHTDSKVTGKPATCTEDGLTDGIVCKTCGETIKAQEIIPASGHKEKKVAAKAATCTEEGLTEGIVCSICGEVIKAQEKIPALGHKEVKVAGKPATCTEDGLTEGSVCEVCGAVTKEQVKINALDHKWDAGVVTKEPTETETGVKTYTCQNDASHTRTEEIEKLAKKSKAVGEIIKTDAVYVVTVEGEAPEVAYKAPLKKNVKSVTIRDTITENGVTYKVTSIARDAFKGKKQLSSVKIKAKITEIGNNAFAGCTALKSITIPKTVKKIGANAFKGDKKLKKITIQSTVLAEVGKNACKGIDKNAVIKVPKKQKKDYQKLLKNKGQSSTVKIQ